MVLGDKYSERKPSAEASEASLSTWTAHLAQSRPAALHIAPGRASLFSWNKAALIGAGLVWMPYNSGE